MEKKEDVLPKNKILRLYNQFPRFYQNLSEMTAQLPKLAEIGFNAVWANPLQETSKRRVNRGINEVSGSLYAMYVVTNENGKYNPQENYNPQFGITNETLTHYIKTARENNMDILFDLVLNHVAIDSPIIKEHPNWFVKDDQWDDVAKCNYTQKEVAIGMFELVWKPMIDKYIDSGFTGIRIDAARLIPGGYLEFIIGYFKKQCAAKGINDPYIFAEVLFNTDIAPIVTNLKNHGITHVTNSLYFISQKNYEANSSQFGKWEQHGTVESMHQLRQISPTVGFAGNHDLDPLYFDVIKNQAKNQLFYEIHKTKNWDLKNNKRLFNRALDTRTNKLISSMPADEIAILAKEKIAFIALTSDSGWYILCGDEFGNTNKANVFNDISRINAYNDKWGNKYNIEEFIKDINTTLAQLPNPTPQDWVEQHLIPGNNNLRAYVRHTGEGFNGDAHIIVVNLTGDKVELSKGDIEAIADSAERRAHSDNAYSCVMRAFLDKKLHVINCEDKTIENTFKPK